MVPVSEGWRTQSLVVITLQVELHEDAIEGVTGLEPKLRDRMMSALMELSHEGVFSGRIENPEILSAVKAKTQTAANELFPGEVGSILVLEMLRRSV